jgi:membrane associated rhomboid family serine protease
MASKLAIALVGCSVVWALLGKRGYGELFPLIPLGELPFVLHPWQPLSYAFLATSPLDVLFGALIVWSLGGALEQRWGPRRLLWFAVGVTFCAALLTCAVAIPATSVRGLVFGGGRVMMSALWVAYGLSFGRTQINFWGIPVTGNGFALIGVGFMALSAVFGPWQAVVPEAFGLGLTYGYMRGLSPRLAWLRFQNWRLQRSLQGRAKHLKLVAKDRNTPSDSDRYLH